MKRIWLKIVLILLMLVPAPFSCKDMTDCPSELDVLPYYNIQGMVFKHVDSYYEYSHKNKKYIMFDSFSQDYDNEVYPCENMALYFEAPDTLLIYHSQHIRKQGFSFTQEAFAECKRSGWAGTRELVDKIYISSRYDFDETHAKDYDLSDIVDIFAYSSNSKENWKTLREYNQNSPYEAPKRFYLLIKRRPTLSKTQQFVIRYYMLNQPGETSEYYVITTPVFQVQ